MADLKISQLTGATTPLAGTEVLPIVQGGATKQVSVANLTAGRTQTSNGIVQGSAATGYNFTANSAAAGMTSQLLNWYEEGTWTPTDASGAGLTLTNETTATYTRVGRLVTVQWAVKYPSTSNANQMVIGGLPFTVASGSYHGMSISQSEYTTAITGAATAGSTVISMFTYGNSAVTNANFSGLRLRGSLTYSV